ncbi:hypothetical protein BU202_06880 [Streptococcus cuniculi]|uniref:Uncharacterized protein n=1 Tax=Streptococcus cuniculi TaxID=1432788 RepID=A0A1Q8E7I4_9STRE|nr:hypothetical protein [Streptococcus cuniculi]OLF47747.1 hypothetical protein BU202_06880 [Streptococcus cuniculi]
MDYLLFLVLSVGTLVLLFLANHFVRDFSPEQRALRETGYRYAMLVMISLMLGFAVFDDLLSYRETLVSIACIGGAVVENYCIWVGAYRPASEPPRSVWHEVLGNGLLVLLWLVLPSDPFIKWIQILLWGSFLFSHLGKYYWEQWKVKTES